MNVILNAYKNINPFQDKGSSTLEKCTVHVALRYYTTYWIVLQTFYDQIMDLFKAETQSRCDSINNPKRKAVLLSECKYKTIRNSEMEHCVAWKYTQYQIYKLNFHQCEEKCDLFMLLSHVWPDRSKFHAFQCVAVMSLLLICFRIY